MLRSFSYRYPAADLEFIILFQPVTSSLPSSSAWVMSPLLDFISRIAGCYILAMQVNPLNSSARSLGTFNDSFGQRIAVSFFTRTTQ